MRILINLLSSSHRSTTGGFVYIKNLLPTLFSLDRANQYFILASRDNGDFFKKNYPNWPNVHYVISDIRRDLWANPWRAGLKLVAKIKKDRRAREDIIRKEVQRIINKKNIDLLFCPASVIYPRGLKNTKIVTTVLDLQHEYVPENFSSDYLKRRKADSEYFSVRSDHLIAISDFTKQTLVQKYGIDPSKVTVIYFAPQKLEEVEAGAALPRDYLFYPAALWPHKNHRILIEALNDLKEKFPSLHLVFAGLTKNKKVFSELKILIESFGLSGKVIFMDYIFGSKLAWVFKNAKAMVFSSSFEGFGIPLVEAFHYGVPVVAADNTSISEVVGKAGILFETGHLGELTKSIERVLSDETLRKNLIARGRERAKDFSWDISARQTLEVFNKVKTDW